MARPNQEAIDTFISVTGASEDVAIRKLQEHGGDLNEAVDAHYSEGDRTIARAVPQNELMDMIDIAHQQSREAASSIFSAAGRDFDAFSPLGPNFGRSLFDSMSEFWSWAPFGSFARDRREIPFAFGDRNEPFVSHPREVREIPIEFKDGNGSSPTIEDVTHASHVYAHEPEIHGTVTFDGEDDG
ncbi:Plant UBX domain-containing protein 8 [Vitis vinifera]|uniref:Plant UBX domain-containing protein 8 n=1 Tax=Vitis vinifera TaxID=29760 RepID=A0A438BZE9_VITVI|nr:Plant UBX domain-containing protein 8 [Vitis vinifera]